MKSVLLLIIFSPCYIFSQNIGINIYSKQKGKLINQIITNSNKNLVLLSAFYADFDGFEKANICELNENHELINCINLSDSTIYWNVELSYDSTSYIFTGIKCSDIYKLDTVIIERRDLDFNLIQKYTYHTSTNAFTSPIVKFDSTYHLFIGLISEYNDNLIELIVPPGLNLTNTKIKIYDINSEIITYFKALKKADTYLGWYLTGIAKIDSSFLKPEKLADSILIRKGTIIDAIDSGYVAFGSAKTNKSYVELGIVKYDLNLKNQKSYIFGEGFNSFEMPAIAYSISKNETDYYVAANINFTFYQDTAVNYLYIGRFNKGLDKVWIKKLGGDRHYLVWGVNSNKSGGCCIYGISRSKETNYNTIPFIMCVDENGSVTSIDEQIPSYLDFTLLGNPGGNELKFNLEGSSSSFTYQVANLKGQIVSSGIGNPGLNIVSATTWPAGVYVISFTNKGTIIHSEKWLKAVR